MIAAENSGGVDRTFRRIFVCLQVDSLLGFYTLPTDAMKCNWAAPCLAMIAMNALIGSATRQAKAARTLATSCRICKSCLVENKYNDEEN